MLLLAASGAAADGPDPSPQPARPPDLVRSVPEVVARTEESDAVVEDPSSFTEVIRPEDYRGEVATTEELLSQAVGVQVRRFGGPGGPSEVSIRGSTSSQVVVQLDGVRLNTAQSGSVDLSTVPLAVLERIEVTRGGAGVQAGSDAIGGVVNLVTIRPGGEPRNRVVGTAGTYETYELSAVRTATLRGLEYTLAYDGFRTEGNWSFERLPRQTGIGLVQPVPVVAERVNNQSERHSALVGLGRSLGRNGHLSFTNSLFYGSRGMPGLDSGSAGAAGQRTQAHQRRVRNLASLRYEAADLGDLGLGLRGDLAYLFERTRFRDPEIVPRLRAPIETDDRNATLTNHWLLDGRGQLGFSEHEALARLEYRRDTFDSDQFESQRRNNVALAVQDEIGLLSRRLRLIPALRWDYTQGFGGEWLPGIGLIVEPRSGVRLKANLERSYRVPNFDELYFPDQGFIRGNPSLEPETSIDGDVGMELHFEHLGPLEGASFQGAWFRRSVDDSIVFLLVSPSLVEPKNTGAATIQGFEVSASLGFGGWVAVMANHTYLDATLDSNGAPLPGRPKNETNVRLLVGPPSRLVKLVVEMQRIDDIPVSDSGGTVIPARTVWDAAVALDLARVPVLQERIPLRALIVSLEGKNLTDETVRDAEFLPQPGRTVQVRLDVDW